MVQDDPAREDNDAGMEPLKQEINRILTEQPQNWVDADSLVMNYPDRLDPIVDYSEFPTLREAVRAGFIELKEEGMVERQ